MVKREWIGDIPNFCMAYVRKLEKVEYFVISDFNWLFLGETDPPARIANLLYTAVKNDVRSAYKAAKAVLKNGRWIFITLIALKLCMNGLN